VTRPVNRYEVAPQAVEKRRRKGQRRGLCRLRPLALMGSRSHTCRSGSNRLDGIGGTAETALSIAKLIKRGARNTGIFGWHTRGPRHDCWRGSGRDEDREGRPLSGARRAVARMVGGDRYGAAS